MIGLSLTIIVMVLHIQFNEFILIAFILLIILFVMIYLIRKHIDIKKSLSLLEHLLKQYDQNVIKNNTQFNLLFKKLEDNYKHIPIKNNFIIPNDVDILSSKKKEGQIDVDELVEDRIVMINEVQNNIHKQNEEIIDEIDTYVYLYNTASANQNDRLLFEKKYVRNNIIVENAYNRFKKPHEKPVYKSSDNGQLFAIPLSNSNNNYLVMPVFGLTINDEYFNAKAFGLIFDCHGYSNDQIKPKIKLIKPALFKNDDFDNWILIEPGKLQLSF